MTSILKTDEIQSQNGGAVVKMQTLKHPNASGNNITLDSSNNVSLGGTLSAGTIGGNVVFPQTGYAQLNLSGSVATQGEITWSTITGDTTNITQSGSDINLGLAGIYLIIFNATFRGTQAERYTSCQIRLSSDDSILARSYDSHGYHDSNPTYSEASVSLVRSFSANTEINFYFNSSTGASSELDPVSHTSIVLIKPA